MARQRRSRARRLAFAACLGHRAIAANVHDEALRAAFLGSLGLSAVSESAA
jgi:hypothetical protein